MKPRLELAKRCLSNDGLIFISIGENEEAYLKILCNKIFGEENKVSSIIWQSKYTVANDKVGISNQTEYILVYAKNIQISLLIMIHYDKNMCKKHIKILTMILVVIGGVAFSYIRKRINILIRLFRLPVKNGLCHGIIAKVNGTKF